MQVYVRLGIRLLYKVCPPYVGRTVSKMTTTDARVCSRVQEGGWKVRGVSDLFAPVVVYSDLFAARSAPVAQVVVDQAGNQVRFASVRSKHSGIYRFLQSQDR